MLKSKNITDLANEDSIGCHWAGPTVRDDLLHGSEGGANVGMHALWGQHAQHGRTDVAVELYGGCLNNKKKKNQNKMRYYTRDF